MTTIAAIEAELDGWQTVPKSAEAERLLAVAERVIGCWLEAHGKTPTGSAREGFRLLALHRQAAQGDPSFNACRETCREIAYRCNLARVANGEPELRLHLVTLRRLVQHLALFISGKLESARLGEFCCSSRVLREADG